MWSCSHASQQHHMIEYCVADSRFTPCARPHGIKARPGNTIMKQPRLIHDNCGDMHIIYSGHVPRDIFSYTIYCCSTVYFWIFRVRRNNGMDFCNQKVRPRTDHDLSTAL